MLKFRAWHKELKFMHEVEILEFFPEELGGITVCFPIPGNNYYDEFKMHEIELMQWTGLQDREDKDIYAGDRCRYVADFAEVDGTSLYLDGFIVFENATFYLVHSHDSDVTALNELVDCELEVIGNIYSNHELLGAK